MHFSGSCSADQRRLSGACGDDGGNGFHTEKRRKRRRAEESGSTAGLRSRPAGVAGLERIHEPDQIHAGSRIRSIRSRASLRDARRTAIPHASLPRSSPFVSVAPFLCVERVSPVCCGPRSCYTEVKPACRASGYRRLSALRRRAPWRRRRARRSRMAGVR